MDSWIVDYKLPGSGYVVPPNFDRILGGLSLRNLHIKFVITDADDYTKAKMVMNTQHFSCPVIFAFSAVVPQLAHKTLFEWMKRDRLAIDHDVIFNCQIHQLCDLKEND